jgi:hypothetical protein
VPFDHAWVFGRAPLQGGVSLIQLRSQPFASQFNHRRFFPPACAGAAQQVLFVGAAVGMGHHWNSDASHTYFIERATGAGSPFILLQSEVPGEAGMTTSTDAAWDGAAFYRVGTDSGGASVPLWLEVPQFLPGNVTVTWTSVTNRSYVVERIASLSVPMLFAPVATNVPGQTRTTSYTDTNAWGPGPFLYRVRVQ